MSTQPTTPHVPPPPAPPAKPTEVKLFSHSNLFYWWPVWVLGYILAGLTYFSSEYMVVVPKDAEARRDWKIQLDDGARTEKREGVLLPYKSEKHLAPNDKDSLDQPPELKLHSTSHKGYGAIFAVVLLVVIFITNVPLRGMWSLLIIMFIVMLSIFFALLGIWDKILATIALLDIRINLGGYMFLSTGLLILWLFAFLFFDRQMYITFQPGQLKVCQEIGSGEKAYDAIGMTIEKEKSDLFRHKIFGLGSGDLIVRTSGADRHEFRLVNVLFVSRKLQQIEELQRTRQEQRAM
jgi:hypothetical protein